MSISLPAATEYAPYYAKYVSTLPADASILTLLREQPAALRQLLKGVTDTEANQPTAPSKWSLKQIVIHMVDTERVFAYRLLAIARGEQQHLPSFEQDDYVMLAEAETRPLPDLLHEHATQRAATVALIQSLSAAALQRQGTAAGQPISARALVWIIGGHEAHHHRLLAQLLQPTEKAS